MKMWTARISRPSAPSAWVVVVAAALVLTDSASASGGVQSLYTDKDHVLELDINTFNGSVYHQPRAFFVEFYASWCGHCIHYKPTWVKFATQIRRWNSTVQATVVNCADEKNSPLCREHAIAAFPTVKYFKVNSASKDDGKLFEGDKYNLPELTRALVKHVKADHDEVHPASWPKLELTDDSKGLEQMWQSAGPDAALLAVVVDNEPYGDGFATLINYAQTPAVQAVVVGAEHPVAKQFGGLAIPSVHLFKRALPQTPAYSSSAAESFEKFAEEIDKLMPEETNKVVEALAAPPKPPTTQVANAGQADSTQPLVVDWAQFEVQYLDITSALHYLFTQEIPRRAIIEDPHLPALKGFIGLLKRHLGLSAPVRRLVYRLDEYLQKQTGALQAEDWLKELERVQDDLGRPLPSNSTYRACRGSKPFLRGYTCGLWTLFHSLTVEAYKGNKHNPNFRPADEVLEPIHQFVFHFLSCTVCAQNFDKMAREQGLLNTKLPEEAVLWLWKGHNRVNRRLSGDASEDPKFPKQQFPPRALCPRCYAPSGEFDEAEVLKFMLQYYSDVKVDGVRPAPGYRVSEFKDGKLEQAAARHLNPKFAGMAGKVDALEESERRLKAERDSVKLPTPAADRTTFYLIWVAIIGLLLFAWGKYRQNRSKFWKTFYYHDYKL